MHNHTFILDGCFSDTFCLEALQNVLLNEGVTQSHLETMSYSYIVDTRRTMKDDEYPRLDKEDKDII